MQFIVKIAKCEMWKIRKRFKSFVHLIQHCKNKQSKKHFNYTPPTKRATNTIYRAAVANVNI